MAEERTALTYIKEARRAWDEAFTALSEYWQTSRSCKSSHPWGSPNRVAQDKRKRRELARLRFNEERARTVLTSRMRLSGLRPLVSGLFEQTGIVVVRHL